jgi:ribonucleoside-triphosphate reductase (thioredoxin)
VTTVEEVTTVFEPRPIAGAVGKPDYLTFELDEEFFAKYRKIPAPFGGPLGEAVFWRTYSRSDNPRLPFAPECIMGTCPCTDKHYHVMEQWVDVCRRVIEGMQTIEMQHCLKNDINWNDIKGQESAQQAFDLLFNFKWTPPGRGLQFMGTSLVHEDGKVEVLQNCAFATTQDIVDNPGEPFRWLMEHSMLGVGVGFDVRGAGKATVHMPTKDIFTYTIPDDREGWAHSIKLLVESYLRIGSPTVKFNYYLLRPAGAPLKRFGGHASGPQTLEDCHRDIRMILDARIGSTITSSDITDIMNIIGVCVVAGNSRRSAEIAIGFDDDPEFMRLKSSEMLKKRPWAWMSNNSVIVKPGADYSELAQLTWENGEPGYFWLDNVHNYGRMNGIIDTTDEKVIGANPCMEQELEPWEMCTLTDIYLPFVEPDERRMVIKHAYRYAKIVTIANERIGDKKAREVMMRNRRIGLSPTGVAQFYDAHGKHALVSMLSEMYDYVRRYDGLYSQWYKVPESIRRTSVKPAGTVSNLPNVTPGAHFAVAGQYYLRRVNMPENSLLAGHLMSLGYQVVPNPYSKNTVVASFPEKFSTPVRSEYDVDIWEQLDIFCILAEYWADNMVSGTLKFYKDKVSPQIIQSILAHAETRLKGLSMLPLDSGIYDFMPFEPLTEEQYEAALVGITPFHIDGNPSGLHQVDDKFCDGEACEINTFVHGG